MKRRAFLQQAVTAALGAGMINPRALLNAGALDKYGGWTGKQFQPTGFFRIEKDHRWWIVTPEGNAFLSFGINHLHTDWFKQEFSSKAWQQLLGIENLDHEAFEPALRTWFLEMCNSYGFNTAGVHNSLSVINRPQPSIAYLQPIRFVNIPHWGNDISDENFLDVFSAEFAHHCDKLAQEIAAPLKDDPYLLGYAMTDCPLLTEEDCRERPDVIGGARRKARIGWPRRLRNLPADAAGKQAYVGLMQKLYHNEINDFNNTYSTNFEAFDALVQAKNWRPHTELSNSYETRDNLEFLKLVVTRYYQTAKDAILRYDPNHLFVGDKLNANTDSLDTVLPVTSQFTDITFYQMYGRYEVQKPGLDRWIRLTDKPIINGDAAFTMITDTQPRPFGPIADNMQQRIAWTTEFFEQAFARPEFVGWHYCGVIDASQLVVDKQDRQHSGLHDEYGEPYVELRHSISKASRNMYQIARRHQD